MTLYANLAQIMGDLGPIEKKGKISSQGSGPTYKFARDSDVLAAAAPRMAAHGIVLVPERVALLSMEPTMSGKQMIANIKSSWLCTDGTDSIRFETFGQGADSGDKALPKAQSNARKYAFFMLYHIVTGDDPDHWASYEQPERDSGQRATSSHRQGGATPVPAVTPAPAQYRRAELAQLLHDKDLGQDDALRYAAIIGIPEDERPMSDASMDKLIDAIKGHGTDAVIESAASPPAVEESSDGVVPSPVTPPKPHTPEYEALKPAEKASARAYWANHPEEEPTLAEQLAVPA